MDFRAHNPSHNDERYKTLLALPKIELHRHLEGTLRLSTLSEIAREHELDLPDYEQEEVRPLVQISPGDELTLDVYLSKYRNLRHFYKSPEIIDRVAYEAVIDAAEENIIYFELRFTPIALARAQGYSLGDAADWVIAAVERAQQETGIEVRLIVTMNRHESVKLGHQMADVAIERMDRGIVAIDLAGNEADFPGEAFAPVFQKARDAGLAVTLHAGEWAGPESIKLALNMLGAERLGHGVRVVEDPALLAQVRERQIPFEVCPTSNIQSGVVASYSQHPLPEMYQAGLLTTINTDGTSVGGYGLTDELLTAMTQLGFSLEDIKQHMLNAAQSAFLPEADRKALYNRLKIELSSVGEITTAHTDPPGN